MKRALDYLLEDWSVIYPGQHDGPMTDWFAVTNDLGIIAYFAEEKDAFAFRLMKINMILNGGA